MTGDISFYCPSAYDIRIDFDEALRYMGVRGGTCDGQLLQMVSDVCELLRKNINCKACYTLLDVVHVSESTVLLGPLEIESLDFKRNLRGCTSAYLFSATVGISVDRFISRMTSMSASRGLAADSLASAAIEGLCDSLCEKLSCGVKLRRRFSPGYGDLSLAYQNEFINMLKAPKNIGIALTSSLMMTPTKSVTAVVGVEDIEGEFL